ncbi:MAG: transglutaminase domain-containing protein [Planctomycetota bacterium]
MKPIVPLPPGRLSGIVAAWLAVVALASSPTQAATPDEPYRAVMGEPVETEIEFRIAVTAPHHTKTLRVWVPIPPSDSAQTCESLGFETFPRAVEPQIGTEPTFGNRFAYFEFKAPRGAQMIEHRLRVTTRAMRWSVDPLRVSPPAEWPVAFEPYLRSDAAIELGEDVDALLGEVAGDADASAPADLRSAMNWLEDNMVYDHSVASLSGSSRHALEQRRGHCSDYHGLCAAFGRTLGYPARITYGLALFPKDSPSHCKLEVFLPPYGWVSFDISETQKLINKIETDGTLREEEKRVLAAAARRRLHAGFREAAWLLVTKGTDYDLAPPAANRVRVVRTIYAEADGRPLPEPDPADTTKREFAWMTAHRYASSDTLPMPFKDFETLRGMAESRPLLRRPDRGN